MKVYRQDEARPVGRRIGRQNADRMMERLRREIGVLIDRAQCNATEHDKDDAREAVKVAFARIDYLYR